MFQQTMSAPGQSQRRINRNNFRTTSLHQFENFIIRAHDKATDSKPLIDDTNASWTPYRTSKINASEVQRRHAPMSRID
jgi:hypothetical protein